MFLQSANPSLTLRSASIRAPELVVNILGSKINDCMSNLSNRVQHSYEGLDTNCTMILERMDGLQRLILQSSQRLGAQSTSFEILSQPIVDNEIQLKKVAFGVISSAQSIVSSRSTVADGSVYDFQAHQERRVHDSSIYGTIIGDEKLERIERWNSGPESLAEGSETSIGIESSHWAAPTSESDSEDEIAEDMFDELTEKGEVDYKEGNIAEAELNLRKALNLVATTNLRSRSAQKLNDATLRLASIYSEQAKFSETKVILSQLYSLSKVDLLPWEVQQKIKASHLLASAHLELKELNEAEKCCKDAMRARRRTVGKNSPDYQESLKLLLAIHEAQGDTGPFGTSPKDRSGKDPATSSFTGSFSSQHTVVQPVIPTRPVGRVDSNPFPLRQKAVPQGHSSLNRVEHESTSANRNSDTNSENFSEPTSSEAEVHPNPPRETPGVKLPNATTSLNTKHTKETAKLAEALSYLETDSGYNFLSVNFDPQVALKTAVNERHIAVAWALLNQLAKVEQIRLTKVSLYGTSPILQKTSSPFPAKLDVNYSDVDGPLLFQTLWPAVSHSLDASAISHQCEMARVLLEAGSNPNIEWSGLTPLLKASDSVQMDFVKVLLDAGADVSCKDENGRTPIHLALTPSNPRAEELVCRLVQHGADVNIGFYNGSITALTFVALHGWEKATRAFLERGARTERKSGTRFDSPLGAAASKGFLSIVKLLLDGGANIEGKSCEVNTFASPLYMAARNGQSEVAELLLARGADIEGTDTVGEGTPLSIAASVGKKNIAKILLDHKANVNATDGKLRTPLHLACMNKHVDIVQVLLEHGANVDAKSDGATPLHLAAAKGSKEVVRIILDHNAGTQFKDPAGLTALEIATEAGNHQVVPAFVDHEAKTSTHLLLASKTGDLSSVQRLLGSGANIEARSSSSDTPLILAAQYGFPEVVSFLLESRAHVNAKQDYGATAVYFAARNGFDAIIRELIEHGADLECAPDNKAIRNAGRTPLCAASMLGFEQTV